MFINLSSSSPGEWDVVLWVGWDEAAAVSGKDQKTVGHWEKINDGFILHGFAVASF